MLQVGNTLTVNLALGIGGIEENVTVTGQTPLVDMTSARVGGNVGTAELSQLPAMNRNYFRRWPCCQASSSHLPTRWATTRSSPAARRHRTATSRWTAATTRTTRWGRVQGRRSARRWKRCRNSRCSPACTTPSTAAPVVRSSTPSARRAPTTSAASSSDTRRAMR